MLVSIGVFDGDLRHIASCGENEIGMLNAVITSIGHADDERTERNSAEQVSNTGFHERKYIEEAQCPWRGMLRPN